MVKRINYELWLFYTAVFIGGFFGGYAMMRSGMFASSQTMNIISMALNLLECDFGEFLVRFGIMVLYAGAIALGVLVPRYTRWDIRLLSIGVTALASLVMAFIPPRITSTLSLLPIFVAMALQWSAFPGAIGYQAACIFLTNNFRQTVLGGVNYLCTKEKQYISQFLFYAGDIFFFFLGFVVCYVGIKFAGFRSVAILLPVTVLMFGLILNEKKTTCSTTQRTL